MQTNTLRAYNARYTKPSTFTYAAVLLGILAGSLLLIAIGAGIGR